MKPTAMFLEGAQWAADLIGYSDGEAAIGVCDNIAKGLRSSNKPEQYKAGARALCLVARKKAMEAEPV